MFNQLFYYVTIKKRQHKNVHFNNTSLDNRGQECVFNTVVIQLYHVFIDQFFDEIVIKTSDKK